MLVRFSKKFCKYGLMVIGYTTAYGLLSYGCGLIAPWLFPVVTIVALVGIFAYFSVKDELRSEAHEARMAENAEKHAKVMEALNRAKAS